MVTTFPFLSLYCVIPSETAQAPDIKPKSFIFYFWDISRCHFRDTSVPFLCDIGFTWVSRDRHNLYLYLLNSELIDLRVRMRKSKCSKWGSERGEKVGSSRKVDWIKIVALTCFLIIQFVKGQWLFSLRVNQSFGLWRSSVRLLNKFTNKGLVNVRTTGWYTKRNNSIGILEHVSDCQGSRHRWCELMRAFPTRTANISESRTAPYQD